MSGFDLGEYFIKRGLNAIPVHSTTPPVTFSFRIIFLDNFQQKICISWEKF